MKLVFVSTGTPSMARDFQEQLGLAGVPIWTDPKRQTYALLGFHRGVRATLLNPRTLLRAVEAVRAGFRQGHTRGDPWQQGGVLVVRPGGKVVYGYASAEAGDHPPTEEVVAQALSARAA